MHKRVNIIYKGLKAKYLFCFLIYQNPDGKYNWEICNNRNYRFLFRKGLIYNRDTGRYLAFSFARPPVFRFMDNLNKKQALRYLREEASDAY